MGRSSSSSASEDPERFAAGATLLVGWRARRGGGVASGPGVGSSSGSTDRSSAVRRSRFRAQSCREPEADSYYVFQLVGLDVEEEGGRALGRVTDVAPGVANDVLELDSGLALPHGRGLRSRGRSRAAANPGGARVYAQ